MKLKSIITILSIILIFTIITSSANGTDTIVGSVTVLAPTPSPSPTPTPTPTPSGSSGSSPSGGGSSSGSGSMGVSTTECFSNVQLKETRENDLRVGTYIPFTFTSDIPVYEVQVKGLKNDYDVAIRVEQLINLSCKLIEKPQGGIYRYLNIFSGVQQDGVKIKFKITNGWLSGGTVVLVRWQDGSWKDLPTTEISKDNKYTYYEAQSSGFSSFAIVERGGTIPKLISAEYTAAQVQPTEQVPFVSEIAREVGVRDLTGYLLIALTIILLLIVGTAYVLIKRCKK